MQRRDLLLGVAGLLSTASFKPSIAQTRFPTRPVRFIVPFAAGGPTDVVARIIADAMTEKWSVPVLVENKAGAATMIGTREVARAEPDGHTLGFVISAHMINPAVRKKMPFDTLSELRGVTLLAEAHIVLAANSKFPAEGVEAFVRFARSAAEPVAYATPGFATATHMAAVLLERAADIKLLHVPYNGSAPALTDVLGNRVPLIFDIWHSVKSFVEAGSLKIIGVANASPIPNAAQYPRIGQIYPGYEASSVFGIVAAANTPDQVIAAASDDIATYIRSPAFRSRAMSLGMVPIGSSSTEFDTFIRRQIEKWRQIAASANISVEQ